MNIAIIDYKMSNMFSIKNALDAVDLKTQITFDRKTILEADGAVLPGVGSFPEAIKHLKNLGLIDLIKEFIASGKPFLGICLGFQLLFEESEEFEHVKGLGVVEGSVKKISSKFSSLPVPHVGWNTIIKQKPPKQNKTGTPSKFLLDDSNSSIVLLSSRMFGSSDIIHRLAKTEAPKINGFTPDTLHI